MSRGNCTITRSLRIVTGSMADYKTLGQFHYRYGRVGPIEAVYKIEDTHPARARLLSTIGVIVYSLPVAAIQLRSIATDGLFDGFADRSLKLQMINKNIRCISRVVIEPRYRSIGLAHWLVSETMKKLDFPIIEALAVMGTINPFFEKAGMKKYRAKSPARCEKLAEALDIVGIEPNEFIDPKTVCQKLESLEQRQKHFIEQKIEQFLQAYGKTAKTLEPGIERTRFFLAKLSARPIYYIWRNPDKQLILD